MKKVCLFFLGALSLFSCSNDDKMARLEVRLTDAPGDYEAVNIDIIGIEIHTEGAGDNEGWRSVPVNGGIYNILDLTGGLDTLLTSAEIPAGNISQIRLILGDNNSVAIDGKEHALSTPSAQQSGLKLNVHSTLTEGITYKMLLDFDAARSIVHKGNNTYSLKPVIRVITEATSGAIKGSVTPAEATPAIYAILTSGDTVATAYANEDGAFLLRGLEAGTYTVGFSPKTGYSISQKTGVSVINGQVTDIGVVSLQN
ncbi:DUF4382 domain-containing protein [Chryseolinea sp. T2]|uniref:DUF4382 domain-containing protein n=1 Tax=Chryseolinea sp. T2 TaxID=3129255 RepID=UPI003076AC0B